MPGGSQGCRIGGQGRCWLRSPGTEDDLSLADFGGSEPTSTDYYQPRLGGDMAAVRGMAKLVFAAEAEIDSSVPGDRYATATYLRPARISVGGD